MLKPATKAQAYFHDPAPFLEAFERDAQAAIAALTADPQAFGLRRPELSQIQRVERLAKLLAEARRCAKRAH
jgi:hypothetical protein